MNAESEGQLMRTHIATLFRCDADGRILSLQRPWSRSGGPPRFFLGRTRDGYAWRFRHDVSEWLVHRLEKLCLSVPLADDLTVPPRIAAAIRAELQADGGIAREYRGPAYVIPQATRASADGVLITHENCGVLHVDFPWMLQPIRAGGDIGPVTAAVADGRAVSICYCARLSREAMEAGVETQEAMRGKGYATAAVATWAAAVRGRGLLPLYSTSWDNAASRRIADKLGAVCYGEDWEIE